MPPKRFSCDTESSSCYRAAPPLVRDIDFRAANLVQFFFLSSFSGPPKFCWWALALHVRTSVARWAPCLGLFLYQYLPSSSHPTVRTHFPRDRTLFSEPPRQLRTHFSRMSSPFTRTSERRPQLEKVFLRPCQVAKLIRFRRPLLSVFASPSFGPLPVDTVLRDCPSRGDLFQPGRFCNPTSGRCKRLRGCDVGAWMSVGVFQRVSLPFRAAFSTVCRPFDGRGSGRYPCRRPVRCVCPPSTA